MHRVRGVGCCKKGGTGVGIGGSGTGARIGGNRHRNGNTYLFRSFCPNPAPVPPFLHHYGTCSTFSIHSCTTTPPPTPTPVPPFLPHSGTCFPPIKASFKTKKNSQNRNPTLVLGRGKVEVPLTAYLCAYPYPKVKNIRKTHFARKHLLENSCVGRPELRVLQQKVFNFWVSL